MANIDFTPQIDFEPEIAEAPKTPVAEQSGIDWSNTAKTIGKSIAGAVSPELTSAVEAINSPIGEKAKELTALPYQGIRGLATGAAQYVPAIQSGDSSQLPTAQAALQRASEATQSDYKPQTTPEKVADIGAQLIEPRSLLASKAIEMAAPLAKVPLEELGIQGTKLQEVLTAVDAENFQKFFNHPISILQAEPSSVTGKALQKAKETAGVTDAENRAIAISDGMRKKLYRTIMDKIDQLTPEQQGKAFLSEPEEAVRGIAPKAGDTIQFTHPSNPTITTKYESPGMLVGSNDPQLRLMNEVPAPGKPWSHPVDSSLSKSTLESYGYKQADTSAAQKISNISVADLLKAKKSGQLIAQSNPSASGLIQSEIHNKINPLLKQMAPDVYNAQQAVHLSKIKESLMSLFPQGKGMMNYFRTISMIGGSLFHGVGALESPVVQAGLTLGAKGAYEAASSTPAKLIAGAGLNRLMNNPDLQSIRDKLKNANTQ